MKTIKRLSFAGMIITFILLVSGCAKDNSSLQKSSQLAVKLSTRKSAVAKVSGSNGFTLNSVIISIADLTIEENSGNDVEQQGNHNDGGSDKEDNNKESADIENGDIILPGPYVLDVIDGKVSIEQVGIYPGTFKKVDFTFLPNSETRFDGNSIIVEGSFQKTDGAIFHVILKSAFNQQVQLPLANGGIIAVPNSTLTITILLDIPAWINNLDFSSAIVLNNEILIDKTNNQELLKLFEANLTSNIVIED